MNVWQRCSRRSLTAVIGLLVLSAMPLTAFGGGDKGDAKPVESKKEASTPASSINFNKDLALDFAGLLTLGGRIEAARQGADPVALAALALELGAAEKVSGKMAAVKSADLQKEAIDLAKVRYNSNELKAVSELTGNKDLLSVAAKAEKHHQDVAKAREAGEKTRGIQGTLHVDSRIRGISIDVFVDGRYVGTVPPFGDRFFFIGQTPWETTFLSARSVDGLQSWRASVRDAVGNFKWTLVP